MSTFLTFVTFCDSFSWLRPGHQVDPHWPLRTSHQIWRDRCRCGREGSEMNDLGLEGSKQIQYCKFVELLDQRLVILSFILEGQFVWQLDCHGMIFAMFLSPNCWESKATRPPSLCSIRLESAKTLVWMWSCVSVRPSRNVMPSTEFAANVWIRHDWKQLESSSMQSWILTYLNQLFVAYCILFWSFSTQKILNNVQGEGGKTDEVNKRQLGAVLPKVKDTSKKSILPLSWQLASAQLSLTLAVERARNWLWISRPKALKTTISTLNFHCFLTVIPTQKSALCNCWTFCCIMLYQISRQVMAGGNYAVSWL